MANRRFQIVATAFDRRGRVIGAGTNDYRKSHPLMQLYAKRAGESEMKIYQHAELAAILSAGRKEIYKILVQRFDAKGDMALAMPCPTCQEMIKDFGIKVVQYTSPSGIQTYKVQNV
jgi:deoxycytidylate deaminase